MNNTFNKEEFAALLASAKGKRSINKYAEETSVSAAHISRFLRQMIESPPTPETISKFADKAHNEVSYKDMMIASGYLVGDNVENESPINLREKVERSEQDIFNIVVGYLMAQDFKWSLEKPEGRIKFPDMIITLEDEKYDKWYIEVKNTISNSMSLPFGILHSFYYRLLTFELNLKDKFTLVVNDAKAYDFIVDRAPVNLRANLYVMLVDLESRKVVKEEQISKYK